MCNCLIFVRRTCKLSALDKSFILLRARRNYNEIKCNNTLMIQSVLLKQSLNMDDNKSDIMKVHKHFKLRLTSISTYL